MADEGTLGLARASDPAAEDASKAELQRRMDEARDSISQTVTEIKDTVVHQYEAVKETINDTLDWREQFKKRPVAWSLGAVGAGFVVGYGIAAIVKGDSGVNRGPSDYVPSEPHAYAAGPVTGEAAQSTFDLRDSNRQPHVHRTETESGPGLVERFQQTEAYDHLRKEAAAVGGRFVAELSQTAQEVVLPAAISWLKQWLTGVLPETSNRPGKRQSGSPRKPIGV
jgi:hypothetical protein